MLLPASVTLSRSEGSVALDCEMLSAAMHDRAVTHTYTWINLFMCIIGALCNRAGVVYTDGILYRWSFYDFAESGSMIAGRNTSANTGREPRVFLSYARSDGEQFAAELRERLEAEDIPLWQDRVGLEGGKDWWQQIKDALDVVEFMVLVMTPAAMQSKMVREEWRYARKQGVCVYPVKGKPDLEFKDMPHWMRSAHFYDLDHEWQKLVNDLNTPTATILNRRGVADSLTRFRDRGATPLQSSRKCPPRIQLAG